MVLPILEVFVLILLDVKLLLIQTHMFLFCVTQTWMTQSTVAICM